jgi:hypothetical protein
MRLPKLLALFAVLTTLTAAAGQARSAGPGWEPATPPSNLNAVLLPVAGGADDGDGDGGDAFGLVRFRQPKDAETIVYLGVWVRGLAPNHSYYLQRATDSTVDNVCTGTNWLTLGQGPVPEQITTDKRGTGRADMFRSLPAALLGAQFDIQFRVIDAVTSAVVLQSACYQFTVTL